MNLTETDGYSPTITRYNSSECRISQHRICQVIWMILSSRLQHVLISQKSTSGLRHRGHMSSFRVSSVPPSIQQIFCSLYSNPSYQLSDLKTDNILTSSDRKYLLLVWHVRTFQHQRGLYCLYLSSQSCEAIKRFGSFAGREDKILTRDYKCRLTKFVRS